MRIKWSCENLNSNISNTQYFSIYTCCMPSCRLRRLDTPLIICRLISTKLFCRSNICLQVWSLVVQVIGMIAFISALSIVYVTGQCFSMTEISAAIEASSSVQYVTYWRNCPSCSLWYILFYFCWLCHGHCKGHKCREAALQVSHTDSYVVWVRDKMHFRVLWCMNTV